MLAATLVAVLSALALGLWAARQAGAGGPGPGQKVPTRPPAESPALDDPVRQILSGIDFVPDRGEIDGLLGGSAPSELIAIARGQNIEMSDPGLRIRAYRALALYPSPDTETVLRAAVAEHGAVQSGVDTLYLRAAMESLANVASAGAPATLAVAALSPMLDHAMRDVRADAARALGATGANSAVPALRARLAVEEVLQVRLALTDALRRLAAAGDDGKEGEN